MARALERGDCAREGRWAWQVVAQIRSDAQPRPAGGQGLETHACLPGLPFLACLRRWG